MHEFWLSTFNNKLIIAPITQPKQILDIGCGTGIWAVAVADNHPDSQVYGIDISPVQPVFVPENCYFYIENVLEGSSFHDEKFDLIQSRCLGAGIPDDRWASYVREIWRITKSAGWVQLIEVDPLRYCDDGSMPLESPLATYEKIVEDFLRRKYGISIQEVSPNLARHIQNAGFINISQTNIRSPLGNWSDGNSLHSSNLQ